MGQREPTSIYREESMRRYRESWCSKALRMTRPGQFMPMLLRMRLSTILLAGLFTNAAVIAAFAGLMYAAGPDCLVFHDDDTHFGNGTRPLFYERVVD
jgi:hypothetical protein